MRITAYSPQYFAQLLQVINESDRVDNANLGMTRDELAFLLCDQDCQPVFLALEDGNVMGYARLAIKEDTHDLCQTQLPLCLLHTRTP